VFQSYFGRPSFESEVLQHQALGVLGLGETAASKSEPEKAMTALGEAREVVSRPRNLDEHSFLHQVQESVNTGLSEDATMANSTEGVCAQRRCLTRDAMQGRMNRAKIAQNDAEEEE